MKTSHDTVPGSMFLVPGSCSVFRCRVLGSGFAVLLFDCVQLAPMVPNLWNHEYSEPLEP